MSRFLNELDGKNLLAQYGVPMAKSLVATTESEAAEGAEQLKYPLVMKILSSDIQHKTEAGCVFLGIEGAEQVPAVFRKILENARSYAPEARLDGVLLQEMAPPGLEVILGMKKDPQFGPVVIVGTGGIYVEVYKDVAMRLLPIERRDAWQMIGETKLAAIMGGARGTVYDQEALIDALMKLSDAVQANPQIEEIDINPLFLYEKGKGAKAVDALIKLTE